MRMKENKRARRILNTEPGGNYLEIRGSIWGDDWSRSLHRTISLLRFSSAVREMPLDTCTAPGIISLSSLFLADQRDTQESGLWLGTQRGGGALPYQLKAFWQQHTVPWIKGQA